MTYRNIATSVLFGLMCSALIFPLIGEAARICGGGICVSTGGGFSTFDDALDTLIDWANRLIPFLLLLATLFFFWGLTKFILNADNEEARTNARNIMIWGVIAVFVMISFWGLVGFLSETLGLTNSPDVVRAPTNLNRLSPVN